MSLAYRRKNCVNFIAYFINCRLIFIFLLSAITGCGGSGGGTNPGILGIPSGPAIYSITLAWDQPETNVDGSELTDLAGYKVYYGIEPDFYPEKIFGELDVKNSLSVTIGNLSSGTYYFAVVAYDTYRNESAPATLYSDPTKNILCVNIPSQGNPYECSS